MYKFFIIFLLFLINCSEGIIKQVQNSRSNLLYKNEEKFFLDIYQLTWGGNNAEGYFSFDDKKIVFQSDSKNLLPNKEKNCDQIFLIENIEEIILKNKIPNYKLISTGLGRTTCSYFLSDKKIIYSSTHHKSTDCPKSQRTYMGKYVWNLFEYDIYVYDLSNNTLKKLIEGMSYEAEATVSPDGKYIIYTSDKSGDLELWLYDLNSKTHQQLTNELGYDGGAFFDLSSRKIVWRASRPKTEEEKRTYKELLKNRFIQPTSLNIFVMDLETKKIKQVTNLEGANWSPFFHPEGNKILFSSNHHSLHKGGRIFNIFMVNLDGTNLEQVTFGEEFEAFPFFSFYKHEGHYWFLFSSNRNQKEKGETNLFLSIWR